MIGVMNLKEDVLKYLIFVVIAIFIAGCGSSNSNSSSSNPESEEATWNESNWNENNWK